MSERMSDLERAKAILRSFEPAVHPAMREMLVKCMAHDFGVVRREEWEEATLRAEEAAATAHEWADRDAYHRGAEEMRDLSTAPSALYPSPQRSRHER